MQYRISRGLQVAVTHGWSLYLLTGFPLRLFPLISWASRWSRRRLVRLVLIQYNILYSLTVDNRLTAKWNNLSCLVGKSFIFQPSCFLFCSQKTVKILFYLYSMYIDELAYTRVCLKSLSVNDLVKFVSENTASWNKNNTLSKNLLYVILLHTET